MRTLAQAASILGALGVLLSPLAAAAENCVDYRDYLHWEARAELAVTAIYLAVTGDHAYLVKYGEGLQVVDISNPGRRWPSGTSPPRARRPGSPSAAIIGTGPGWRPS